MDINLYYYNARYYDPALGRFVQSDTIVPGAGSIQSYDRYAYVNNNPIRYTDPSGHGLDCGINDPYCNAAAHGMSYETYASYTPYTPTLINTDNDTIAAVCGSNSTGCVTPVVDDATHFANLDIVAAEYGYNIVPVPYKGDKQAQADAISVFSPNKKICYSAGVDSCLLYASAHLNPEDLQIVLIGGGYTLEDGSIRMNTGSVSGFEDGFVGIINDLAEKGAHILVIYDGNQIDTRDYIKTEGNILAVESKEYHYLVDDPDSSIWEHVFAWFDDPTYPFPTHNWWAK